VWANLVVLDLLYRGRRQFIRHDGSSLFFSFDLVTRYLEWNFEAFDSFARLQSLSTQLRLRVIHHLSHLTCLLLLTEEVKKLQVDHLGVEMQQLGLKHDFLGLL